ncbi:DDB1- and CUL4-associated factor 11-like [Phaenicophaeus curvirostris]|uniref:DDB1- and CUL4-associated factor 11-like n=1 Tax=Phaenicophaeus curvirostris TaxID=33595 RepID=UPI0037F0E913
MAGFPSFETSQQVTGERASSSLSRRSWLVFQNFVAPEVYEEAVVLRNNDLLLLPVPRLVKVTTEISPYFKLVNHDLAWHKVPPGRTATFHILFIPEEKQTPSAGVSDDGCMSSAGAGSLQPWIWVPQSAGASSHSGAVEMTLAAGRPALAAGPAARCAAPIGPKQLKPAVQGSNNTDREAHGHSLPTVATPGKEPEWDINEMPSPQVRAYSNSSQVPVDPPELEAKGGRADPGPSPFLLELRGGGPPPRSRDPEAATGGRGLYGREWGRSFSAVEQNRLSSRFLPNAEVFAATYPHKAFCGVFNGDGSLFVSACQDHSLRVYGAAGRGLRLLRSTRGRDVGWSILDVAFTPDGRHGLYCSWSPYVHTFNIHGEDETHMAMDLRPPDRRFALFSLAVGPGGQEVWGGANNGCVYVYDRGGQRRVLRVEVHEADVNAVALADAGGQLVLSGGDDGLVRLWDRRSLGHRGHRPVCRLAGHRGGVTFIHRRRGRHLVSNSKDQTAKLWNLRRPAGDGAVAAARRAVATQSWDYRWEEAPPPYTFRGHVVLHTLLRCRLAPAGGRALGAGCASGGVIVYDVLTGRVLRRLSRHRGCVRDVCWGPQPWRLASASWDGTVRLWGYHSPQAEEDEEEEEEEEGAPQ